MTDVPLAERPYVLGVDVGGTKLAAGLVTRDGRVHGFLSVPAHREQGPDRMIERHVELCRASAAAAAVGWDEVGLVGIGCGGPLDPVRGIIQSPMNLPGWDDIPIVARFEAALDRPAVVDNDATAAALAEAWYGAGRGCRSFVYLTISTGIGGGYVLDGRPERGANGNAAELGHISVDITGWPCVCGRRGCLEAFASGTNIARRAREAVSTAIAAGDETAPAALLALAGSVDAITAAHVAAAAALGDPIAVEVWEATTRVLGAGLATVLNVFNPDRVALGGGVTQAGELLLRPVRGIAKAEALPPAAAAADIVRAELGPQLGVIAAAAVAMERAGIAPAEARS